MNHSRSPAPPLELPRLEEQMLAEYADNRWFLDTHWPENRERALALLRDAAARHAPGPDQRVLDVGCFNGYVTVLFRLAGFSAVGADASDYEERTRIFSKLGIEQVSVNLNTPAPFAGFPDGSFDVVVMGEVFEHVLNHPLGLLRDAARLLRPGGTLLLTTPNPSTVQNAVRVLRGATLMWGTDTFLKEPKFEGDRVIADPGIHYREYTTAELGQIIAEAGFQLEELRYMGMGSSGGQSLLKRLVKSNGLGRRLMEHRLFGNTHYLVARRA